MRLQLCDLWEGSLPSMLAAVAPVLLQLSLSISPRGCSIAASRASHCVALAKGASKRTGGGGGFGAKPGGGSGGGFGAQPPSLEEVVATFKTRLPEDGSVECPCGSGEGYQACCQPCHAGGLIETPERCLRCRSSAVLAHVRPGASVLYVRATRISLLRAVRTGGAGQLALAGHHCTYAVRVPASGVPYVPRTVAPQAAAAAANAASSFLRSTVCAR